MTEVLTSLSREQRGRIITKFDHSQRLFDEAQAAALAACRSGVRGDAANGLLRQLDMAADFMQRHRREVGRLLDDLTEDESA